MRHLRRASTIRAIALSTNKKHLQKWQSPDCRRRWLVSASTLRACAAWRRALTRSYIRRASLPDSLCRMRLSNSEEADYLPRPVTVADMREESIAQEHSLVLPRLVAFLPRNVRKRCIAEDVSPVATVNAEPPNKCRFVVCTIATVV